MLKKIVTSILVSIAAMFVPSLSETLLPAGSGALAHANEVRTTVDVIRLVVMIEAVTSTGGQVKGAGLMVGRSSGGDINIVTARHVVFVDGPNHIEKISVRLYDTPKVLVPAKLVKHDFGTTLDLAVLSIPADLIKTDLMQAFRSKLRVARMEEPYVLEEAVDLVGQTSGERWSNSSSKEKITEESLREVRVQSAEAGPGLSGGVAMDSSRRIIGIVLSEDRYVVKVLKFSAIAELLARADIEFALAHGEKRLIVTQDVEQRLQTALMSGRADLLREFQPSKDLVPLVLKLFNSGPTLNGLLENLSAPDALTWLRSLIQSGLNTNSPYKNATGEEGSLLYGALSKNNIKLAVLLLEGGASPYMYRKLWGVENRTPFLLLPLGVLNQISGEKSEKARLVSAFVKAGLTRAEIRIPKGYTNGEQIQEDDLNDKEIAKRYSVEVPVQNSIHPPVQKVICEREMAIDGYDWCEEVKRLPKRIYYPRTDWMYEFADAQLINILGVFNGKMYVRTFSLEGGNAPAGYGLMIFTKGADKIEWYRFMGSGFGMGHCEELRGLPNWKPHQYEKCWKLQTMYRSASQGSYYVSDYKNVVYLVEH